MSFVMINLNSYSKTKIHRAFRKVFILDNRNKIINEKANKFIEDFMFNPEKTRLLPIFKL